MLDETLTLALQTVEMGKQAIIFAPSRASAEKTAEDIAKHTQINQSDLEHDVLDVATHPTKQCRRLSHCIKKGIAFHHAGLLPKQRDIIETNFRTGKIKIICATPTLAAGLSMPAYRVIIKSLKRFSGGWGMDWIPVLEYMQMAGRAGRPEYEKVGQAITIAKDHKEKEEIYDRYICGVPEDLYSKLAVEPVLRTYLLALISSGVIKDEISMQEFFKKTFWAHQYKDLPRLIQILNKMSALLEEWGFILIQETTNQKNNKTQNTTDQQNVNTQKNTTDQKHITSQKTSVFTSALDLIASKKKTISESKTLKPTLIGKRVSQLYLDPLTAKHFLDCITKYDQAYQKQPQNNPYTTFSLLQMICHTLEIRPLLTIKSKEHDLIQEELNKRYGQILEPEPNVYDPEYSEFMSSIKTTMFFQDWIDEKDEDFLLEKFDIKPGEIYAKKDTALWLISSAAELANLEKHSHLARELMKLHTRIEYGVKEEILELLKLKNIGRVRARKLFNHHITNLNAIKTMPYESLKQILGEAVAIDIKAQLGEKIAPTINTTSPKTNKKSKENQKQQNNTTSQRTLF